MAGPHSADGGESLPENMFYWSSQGRTYMQVENMLQPLQMTQSWKL
jgi:hypothetical protein